MHLNETPETVTWPETRYLFIERTGPFQETAPKAWQELHGMVPAIQKQAEVTGYLSLYKVNPEMIYRAGVSLAARPVKVPDGLEYTVFKGGKYARFVLTGPYSDLPQACGRVFEIVEDKKLNLRADF